jgi:hypothetical protein
MCKNCDTLLAPALLGAVCSEGKVTRCGLGREKHTSVSIWHPLEELRKLRSASNRMAGIWSKRVPNTLRNLTYVSSVVINLCAQTLAAEILWNHMHVQTVINNPRSVATVTNFSSLVLEVLTAVSFRFTVIWNMIHIADISTCSPYPLKKIVRCYRRPQYLQRVCHFIPLCNWVLFNFSWSK